MKINTSAFNKVNPILLGALLFLSALLVGFLTYKDYGISWDETYQHETADVNYNYITKGDTTLFHYRDKRYGAGFEIPLMAIEKKIDTTEPGAIYEMRHLVTHVYFLVAALAAFFLFYRLFKDNLLATLGFLMLVLMPRIYAHSFFNPKDLPFLSSFLISLSIAHYAFEKRKPLFFALLGIMVGYTTGLRVMGIMLAVFVMILLLWDTLQAYRKKEAILPYGLSIGGFIAAFCLTLVSTFPYLWVSPYANFWDCYDAMSHYNWDGTILVNGNYERAMNLPSNYFRSWFSITVPMLWIATGITGIVWLLIDFFKNIPKFLEASNERFLVLLLMCFAAPIFAVQYLHSVIYDDWRHLYFVYPSFVGLGLYGIKKILDSKFQLIMLGACAIQLGYLSYFMVNSHPFQQVYFNYFVSHEEENLRQNFELDYWGCSFKQGLEYLVKNEKADTFTLMCGLDYPVENNLLMLKAAERKRIKIVHQITEADYFITNFRWHKEDYESNNIAYDIKVLNSSILTIYKIREKGVMLKTNIAPITPRATANPL